MEEASLSEFATIGLDIAKTAFHAHAALIALINGCIGLSSIESASRFFSRSFSCPDGAAAGQ